MPAAKKKAVEAKNNIEIPEDAYVNWQLYRSRKQIYASPLDHDAQVEGKQGKAGDYIAYNGEEYFLIPADEFPNYQPIAPSERAKQL